MTPTGRHRRHARRRRVETWCDRLVVATVGFVLLFGPFAFGSVHPQAYGLLEIAAAVLVAAWLVKVRFSLAPDASVPVLSPKVWIPLGGLLGLAALQLVPLPPGLLRVISPSTYELYATALPGWPAKAPYEDLVRRLLERDDLGVQPLDLNRPVALPVAGPSGDVDLESIVPDAWSRLPGESLLPPDERVRLERWVERDHRGVFSSWRSISVDPARTYAELLKILAYVGVFCVVSLYPFERRSADEERFQRRLLWVAVVGTIGVAAVALLQRYSWNGKILWVFVPWDWGAPRPDAPQTSGPFVSRNNFGGYLALMWPLVLAPVLAPTRIDLPAGRRLTCVVYGGGAALVAVALSFSLSRGAWGAAVVGLATLLVGLVRAVGVDERARFLRTPKGFAVAALASGVAILFLLQVPSGGRSPGNEIDRRLQQTVHDSASWENRVAGWRDSLPMMADFPVFGVGLASWGSLFPKYDRSHFFGTQSRRAHNDYLQAFVETGLVGGALLIALLLAVAHRLVSSIRARSPRTRLIPVAIVAGLAALFVHELVDFDLQIPGIAFSAVVLVGVSLRESWREVPVRSFASRTAYGITALGALALIAVVRQPTDLHPRVRGMGPASLLAIVARGPTNSEAHVRLAASTVEYVPSGEAADVAVDLNPSHPLARDVRALLAQAAGDDPTAMAELEESFFRAPSGRVHPLYFGDEPRALSDAEWRAIRSGFERAVGEVGFRAAYELALVLRGSTAPQTEGEAWRQVAQLAKSPRDQAIFLRAAAVQFVAAGRIDEAERLLLRARELAPSDFRIWTTLIAGVFRGRHDLDAAERAVVEAQAVGADPYEIQLALAEVARSAGNFVREREALEAAVSLRPGDPRGHFLLGMSRYRAKAWAGAAAALRRAVELKPVMAESWYYLGHSEEKRYAFADASAAYKKALALSPRDRRYQRSLVALEGRLRDAGGGGS